MRGFGPFFIADTSGKYMQKARRMHYICPHGTDKGI
jgi:hypothetical protein